MTLILISFLGSQKKIEEEELANLDLHEVTNLPYELLFNNGLLRHSLFYVLAGITWLFLWFYFFGALDFRINMINLMYLFMVVMFCNFYYFNLIDNADMYTATFSCLGTVNLFFNFLSLTLFHSFISFEILIPFPSSFFVINLY